jgi:uncharacterized protein YjbJ (UPF0337 family)
VAIGHFPENLKDFLLHTAPQSKDLGRRFDSIGTEGALEGMNILQFRAFPPWILIKEEAMDWNRVEGNWKQVKGKIQEQWGKLTDDDISILNGNREQLEGVIQERYGIAKDQAKAQIDDWYDRQKWG